MSHFVVYVFGDNPDYSLMPYEESPDNNDYIEFEDKEEDYRKEYENGSYDAIKFIKADGEIEYYFKFDDELNDLPKHRMEEVKRKFKEEYPTFEEYMKGYHDDSVIHEIDGVTRYGYYHNPNAKWDWYSIGGRWNGKLNLKNGDKANIAPKKDINFTDLPTSDKIRHSDRYSKVKTIVEQSGDLNPKGWSHFHELYQDGSIDIETARSQYRSQPAIKAINSDERLKHSWDCLIDYVYKYSLEEYLEIQRMNYVVPFAFIDLDGDWHERGRMGWWGMVADEKEQEKWYKEFMDYLDEVSEDTVITVIDCHI